MTELDDHGLLEEYAYTESETAFATLVTRYVNLVYSAALRFTGNSHQAEEITQTVFIILARKAGSLCRGTVLAGWLYQTARLTSANFVKGEARRQRREQEVYMQSTLGEPESVAWKQIAPLLDDAMGRLRETDRSAIVLRFFENKSLREIATAMRITESSAHMRVTRALEKLRTMFAKRGVTLATVAVGGAMCANSVQAAPIGLVGTVTAATVKGAVVSTSTLTLIKGTLKLMAWTKAKTAIVVSIGVFLAAGTTVITVKEIQERKTYPWQTAERHAPEIFDKTPPQVRILPTKGFKKGSVWMQKGDDSKFVCHGFSAKHIIILAFQNWSRARILYSAELPSGEYDVMANLAHGSVEALRQEIETTFGLVVKPETREANVFVLKAKEPISIPALPVTTDGSTSSNSSPGWIHTDTNRMTTTVSVKGQSISYLISRLEMVLEIPVIDQTGLTNTVDVDLEWDTPYPNLDGLKQALVEQLGLELVPSREPVEMLVIEKAE